MNLKLWLGILISAVFLWLAARDVDFESTWAYIQNVNLFYLIPYVIVVLGEVLLRAWKWRVLLTPTGPTSFRGLSSATLIGLMANNVLPGRAGEFVRAYVGARMERISFSTSLATVVIDRVLDGLTVSAIFLVVLLTQPLPEQVKIPGYLAATVYAITLGFLWLLLAREAFATRIVAALARRLPVKAGDLMLSATRAFVEGLGALRSKRLVSASVGISVIIWLGYGFTVFLMALAMDIHLSIPQALVVLIILTILITLPSTPGFLGAMELGIKLGLQLFGVDESQAFAFAVLFHVTQYVPITVGGFIAVWFERMSMQEIRHASSREALPAPS